MHQQSLWQNFRMPLEVFWNDLQATYEYLTEGETEMALEIYKGISKVAGEMHKAAANLQKEFDRVKKRVRGIHG